MSAIEAYRAALGGGALELFPITALDRTEVPVWTGARFAPGEPTAKGFGFGATDAEAELSALGETLETFGAARTIPGLPRRRGSFRALTAEGAVDPVSLVLPAGAAYDPDRVLEWVPARRWRTGEAVLLPIEAVATEPGELGPSAPEPLFTPITNGLGAGDTLERAVAHGLLELVQRDGNSVSQRALDAGVRVDVSGLREPLLDHLAALGIEVLVKACESDLGIANVAVVGAERDLALVPSPLVVTAGGEGAHPSARKAIRKAALEFCASRVRKVFSFGPVEAIAGLSPPQYLSSARSADPSAEEPRALAAMLDWLALDAEALRAQFADPVLAVRRTVGLDTLPESDVGEDPAAALAFVLERLADFDVLWVDLSPPGGDVRIVKVVVPGLEVETASYARIGRRNLARLRERDLGLVGDGPPAPGAEPILLPAGDPPAWLHTTRLRDAVVGPLYALYREPGRHTTTAGARQRAS